MSVTRPLRCLFAQVTKSTASRPLTITSIRQFHSTPITPLPRKRPGVDNSILPHNLPYSREQIAHLQQFYSPEQLDALLIGEAVINREDFENRQPRDPHDPYGLRYVSDLSTFDPLLDFPIPQKDDGGKVNYTPPPLGHPEQPIPVINDPSITFPQEEPSGVYRGEELSQLTGYTTVQLKKFTVRNMVFHRVVNQTRMGKIQKFYALTIAGNGNGLLGIGEGKSVEPEDARQIASYMALRNVEPIPRYEGRTIYGKVQVKFGAVELELRTAPPGYGIRASEPIFEMCRALGIQDLSAKITRSTNRMNVCKAVMEGLRNQKLPDQIARGRGIKLADVRKVYYNAANVYTAQRSN